LFPEVCRLFEGGPLEQDTPKITERLNRTTHAKPWFKNLLRLRTFSIVSYSTMGTLSTGPLVLAA
jgi:hypothetical protein